MVERCAKKASEAGSRIQERNGATLWRCHRPDLESGVKLLNLHHSRAEVDIQHCSTMVGKKSGKALLREEGSITLPSLLQMLTVSHRP